MEPYKLRVKIGEHEFEAEGPEETVRSQFEEWKALFSASSEAVQKPATTPEQLNKASDVLGIFSVDERKKLVSLRVQPTGTTRDADAILLLLYGYKKALALEDVPVTRIKESMEISGLKPKRIDRTIAPHFKLGYILKAGRAKGSRYRLSNTGQTKAGELAQAVESKMA